MVSQIETLEIDTKFFANPGDMLEISRIGLGTWAIGGWMWGGTDEADAIRTIHEAVDRGVTLIDTAPAYGFGRSEEIVGKALAEGGRRKRVLIATKVGLDWRDGQPFRNASKTRIRKEIEDSLRRLRTDVIDIYQVHWPDPNVPIEETAGSDGGFAVLRQDSGDRRQQFQPLADRGVSQGCACADGAVAIQSVRESDRKRRPPLLSAEKPCHACLRLIVQGSALRPHDGTDTVCRGRPTKDRPEVQSSSIFAIPASG